MKRSENYPFTPTARGLALEISQAGFGFQPQRVWNPSPSETHRSEPYAVPQTLVIGVRSNPLTCAKFSPPPIAVIVEGKDQEGRERRCFIGVRAESGWHRWNTTVFEASAEGVRIEIDLEGRTDPTAAALHINADGFEDDTLKTRHELLAAGVARQYPLPENTVNAPGKAVPDWWLRPIYCGWGDQVAQAIYRHGVGPEGRANGYCRQSLYEHWVGLLEKAEVPVGTVTIDAGWSHSGVWEPNRKRWPDLRGFIEREHAAGRKVLLWIATWLGHDLPEEWYILADGKRWAIDPTHPEYIRRMQSWVHELLSPDGYNADGFKIDQLAHCPNASAPRFGPGVDSAEPVKNIQIHGDAWGIELLYEYQKAIYEAAKAAKPDCLVTSSTVHPYFYDTFDMVRLHDTGRCVPEDIIGAMKVRSDLSRAALPGFPIDTDDWMHTHYERWLDYTCHSWKIGVPCIFFTEHFISNWFENPGTMPLQDLPVIAAAWREAGYEIPSPRQSECSSDNREHT